MKLFIVHSSSNCLAKLIDFEVFKKIGTIRTPIIHKRHTIKSQTEHKIARNETQTEHKINAIYSLKLNVNLLNNLILVMWRQKRDKLYLYGIDTSIRFLVFSIKILNYIILTISRRVI